MADVYVGVGTDEIAAPGASDNVRIRLLLADDADPTAGKTGIAFDAAGMVVAYSKHGASAFTAFPTFATENWDEIGYGWYDLILRGSDAGELALLDTAGPILFHVKATATKQAPLQKKVVSTDTARIAAGASSNLEDMYDGTGYTDPVAPAQQQQLDSLANVGAAINTPSDGNYVLTTGTQVSGTEASTEALDEVYHQHTDAAGTLELYYQFDVGSQGVPTGVTFTGRINGNNDDSDVWAYNWLGASWDQIGVWPGKSASTDDPHPFTLFTSHVGTGANLGKVRIRIYQTGLTSANLYVDQVYVSYAVVNTVGGYDLASVWIDTVNGASGTVADYNGTVGNPVDNIADANTIATSKGLSRFQVLPGSSITFAASQQGQVFQGHRWTLALGGQDIAGSTLENATVSGVGTGATAPKFRLCTLNATTLPPCELESCRLANTLTAGSAGDFHIEGCRSAIAGVSTPTFDFGAALNASNVNFRDHSGGVEIENMGAGTGSYNMSLEGWGQLIINANCSATSTVVLRGHFPETDNAAGAVTVVRDANYVESTLVDAILDEVISNSAHNVAQSLGQRIRQITAPIIREETAQGAGTGSNQIQFDTGASATDGAYDPGRVDIVGGTGAGQSRLILQYDGTTKTATVDRDWKTNPDVTSDFLIMGFPGREHVNEGLAQAGTVSTITLNVLGSSQDDAYNGQVVLIRSGTGQDQARRVSDYNGMTKVANVSPAWDITPDTTSGYVMLPTGLIPDAVLAAAVWGAIMTSYEAASPTGAQAGHLLAIIRGAVAGAVTGAGDTKSHRNIADDAELFAQVHATDYEERTAPT